MPKWTLQADNHLGVRAVGDVQRWCNVVLSKGEATPDAHACPELPT